MVIFHSYVTVYQRVIVDLLLKKNGVGQMEGKKSGSAPTS
jgi:hypothetical protein